MYTRGFKVCKRSGRGDKSVTDIMDKVNAHNALMDKLHPKTQIYKEFGLSQKEYKKHRFSMLDGFYTVKEEAHQCRVLYFDGDDGAVVFTKPAEVFDTEGFKMELIDCTYCDVSSFDMLDILTLLENFKIDYDALEE